MTVQRFESTICAGDVMVPGEPQRAEFGHSEFHAGIDLTVSAERAIWRRAKYIGPRPYTFTAEMQARRAQ